MAFNLPELMSRTDTKSRILLVLAVVAGLVILIYAGSHLFGGKKTASTSKVAGAPTGLQSVPGSQLSPEYYRALMQANAQSSQQAQISGGSAVPTLVNVSAQQSGFGGSGNCTTQCPGGEAADVTDDVNDLVKQGKLTQEEANKLLDFAKNNVSVNEYAASLDALVKQGKLTPEQARKLLSEYKRQHANALVTESAKTMDALIKSGKLPLDVATQLLELQKQSISPAEYSAELNRLVKEGKISPAVAAQLLAQYTQQRTREDAKESAAELQQMAKSGQIAPEVATQLAVLQKRNVTVGEYSAALDKLVAEGKMTPATAAKLLAEYQQQHAGSVGAGLNELTQAADAAAAADVADIVSAQSAADVANIVNGEASSADIASLLKDGKISQETANQLTELQKKNMSPEEYQQALDELVKSGKISPEAAKRLMADYNAGREVTNGLLELQKKNVSPEEYQQALDDLVKSGKISPEAAKRLMAQYNASKVVTSSLLELQNKHVSPQEYQQALDALVKSGKLSPEAAKRLMESYNKLSVTREEAQKLEKMQGSNASVADYAAELKRAVAAGLITQEKADSLLQAYQAMQAPSGAAAGTEVNVPGGEDLSRLQQRLQPGQKAGPTAAASTTAGLSQAELDAAKLQQQHIQEIMGRMSGQAKELVSAWAPRTMQYKGGQEETKKEPGVGGGAKGGAADNAAAGGSSAAASQGPPIIKAGTILFAVLETAVNSDYPDSPVMATIVSGDLKGARLLGKLAVTTKGQDKVSLTFNLMNNDAWDKSKSVTAFAIDPDTARTVLANNVDYHYMLRYGTLFASSFVSGYASAISSSSSTTTSGIFGTSTSHPALSPGEKLAVGLGQVGTTFGTALQSYITTPPTVKVNAGVGLGILFMSDVSA